MTMPRLARYYSEKEGGARGYRHPHTGLMVPGVTSITKLDGASDGGGLPQYAADVTLKWAVENWSLLGSRSDESSYKAGRFRWKDHTNFLAQVGTNYHEVIEHDLNGEWDLPEVYGEAAEAVDQWWKFKAEHEIETLYTEVTAWSDKYGYAGTLDCALVLDGEVTLADVKTSRSLRHGHMMQVAALARADYLLVETEAGDEWEVVDIPAYTRYGFIHLRQNYYNPVTGKSEAAYQEWHEIDPQFIDPLFEEFVAYRQIHRLKGELKEAGLNE